MTSIIDGHVHIHKCFPLDSFLSSAYQNIQAVASALDGTGESDAVLLLTESAGDDRFDELKKAGTSGGDISAQWRFEGTQEDQSLVAVGPSGEKLILIAGLQIVTAENLEILWIGTTQRIPDGMPMRQILTDIYTAEGIAVIPWGPGKWFGKRGKIVEEIVHEYKGSLFLGDNGNRPIFWPTPTLLKQAPDLGIQILPGSDPLPMASETSHAGKFGFCIDAKISHQTPFSDLLTHIHNPDLNICQWGRLESPGRFFRNQIAMQLIKQGLMKR